MDFVIDASIVAAYMLEDERSIIADSVVESLVKYTAMAPSFWSLEISNILLSAEKRRRITSAERSKLLHRVQDLEIIEEVYSQERIFSRVLPIAEAHGLSAYDAFYLEQAFRLSLPLATLDKKLQVAAKSQGVLIFEGEF